MPAIIDSAPDCVTTVHGGGGADAGDFIVQVAYQKCLDGDGGFMTFGPGTVYGEDGFSATTQYYVLTWIGIAVMVLILVAYVVVEHRKLLAQAKRLQTAGVHVEAGE